MMAATFAYCGSMLDNSIASFAQIISLYFIQIFHEESSAGPSVDSQANKRLLWLSYLFSMTQFKTEPGLGPKEDWMYKSSVKANLQLTGRMIICTPGHILLSNHLHDNISSSEHLSSMAKTSVHLKLF